jgi:hypothetical protein
MPEDMPKGQYDVGIRVAAGGNQTTHWQGAVGVTGSKQVDAAAQSALAEAVVNANNGLCGAAIESWDEARLLRPRAGRWRKQHRPTVGSPIAACLVREARAEPEPLQVAQLIRRARKWAPALDHLERFAKESGAKYHAEGMTARIAGDWDLAFNRFSAAVGVEPQRAWSRRYAEEARAKRLDRSRK